MTTTVGTLSRRKFLYLSSTVAGSAALLAACGGSNAPSGPVTIKFWNGSYSTSDANNKDRKPEDFYINQAVARFQKENPTIKISMQNLPQTVDMFTQFRVASIARNGPDVMATWSGSYLLQFKQYLEPMDGYFSAQERSRIAGWDAVTDGYKVGTGKTYGIPSASGGISTALYNKELLQNAGINPETNWPQDFDGFLAMLEKIKATGVTPIAFFDNGYTLFSLDYWIAQTVNGSSGVGDLVSGKMNFNQPALVEVIKKWVRLAPYAQAGATTAGENQAEQLLLQKKAALTIDGPWAIKSLRQGLGDKLGLHKLPNFNASIALKDTGIGGAGGALLVTSYSKHKDESVKFAKFLMSKAEQTEQAKLGDGNLVTATDIDFDKTYSDPLTRQVQRWALEPKTIFWPDNIYPPELTNELVAQAQRCWNGQISADDFLKRLDAKRDELLKAPK